MGGGQGVAETSTLSQPLWEIWAEHSLNKDCSQSFPGPLGRPKEPTRGLTFSHLFVALVVDPLVDSIRRLPDPMGGSGRICVRQKIAPRAPQGLWAAPRSPQEPQHFQKKIRKFRIANRAPELILSPWVFFKMPNRSKTTPAPQEFKNIGKNLFFQEFPKIDKNSKKPF